MERYALAIPRTCNEEACYSKVDLSSPEKSPSNDRTSGLAANNFQGSALDPAAASGGPALPRGTPVGYQNRGREHRSFVRWGAPPMLPAPLLIGRCLRREGEPAQVRELR